MGLKLNFMKIKKIIIEAIIVAGITGIIGVIIRVIFCLPDFSISVESLQGSVEQGGSIETRIIVKNKSIIPYKGEVRLNYTEHPSDIFITFDPQTKKPDYNSTMRIQTEVNTQVGSYTIKIKGNGSDEKEHNISYVLTVNSKVDKTTIPACGNGYCDSSETCSSCSQDCGCPSGQEIIICTTGTTQSQACGNCGNQTKTCLSNYQWGSWGACTGEGICSPNQTQSQACGHGCTQTRSCDSNCQWGNWGTCQCSEEIIITDPPQNYTIPITYTVQGTITTSEPNPNIWVIVHPAQTNQFWVEPEANFSDQQHETTWQALIYIGEEEARVGEHFEIMAVVNPTQTLTRGMILDNWPESQKSSEIIRVTRELN